MAATTQAAPPRPAQCQSWLGWTLDAGRWKLVPRSQRFRRCSCGAAVGGGGRATSRSVLDCCWLAMAKGIDRLSYAAVASVCLDVRCRLVAATRLRLAETTAAAAYKTQPQWTHGTAIRHAARAVREVRLPSEAGETDRWLLLCSLQTTEGELEQEQEQEREDSKLRH
jgi:hypothetical protein